MGYTVRVNGMDRHFAPQRVLNWLDCVEGAQLTSRGGVLEGSGIIDRIDWEEWTLFRSGKAVGVVRLELTA
jgi:hypothetical protein